MLLGYVIKTIMRCPLVAGTSEPSLQWYYYLVLVLFFFVEWHDIAVVNTSLHFIIYSHCLSVKGLFYGNLTSCIFLFLFFYVPCCCYFAALPTYKSPRDSLSLSRCRPLGCRFLLLSFGTKWESECFLAEWRGCKKILFSVDESADEETT